VSVECISKQKFGAGVDYFDAHLRQHQTALLRIQERM